MCFVDVAEWHRPMAGMFLWIKLKDIKDTQRLIMERALEKEVHTHRHTHTQVYWGFLPKFEYVCACVCLCINVLMHLILRFASHTLNQYSVCFRFRWAWSHIKHLIHFENLFMVIVAFVLNAILKYFSYSSVLRRGIKIKAMWCIWASAPVSSEVSVLNHRGSVCIG